MKALLYTYFCNISLNVLRPTFLTISNLPFSPSRSIGKISVKVGPKTIFPTSRAPAQTELQSAIIYLQ